MNVRRLQHLSIEAWFSFLRHVFDRDIMSQDLDPQICWLLNEKISNMVSPSLAVYITERLLKCVDCWYEDKKEDVRDDIIQQLVCAVIHPDTTRLNLMHDDPSHYVDLELRHKYIIPFVFKTLHTLKRLKVLQIGPLFEFQTFTPHVTSLSENLLELIFLYNCTDSVISTLSDYCKNLRWLDVSFSSRVTDESVQNLLVFECLESLRLLQTGISSGGVTKLLNLLSHSTCRANLLKSLGSELKSGDMEIIINNFQNLVRLDIGATHTTYGRDKLFVYDTEEPLKHSLVLLEHLPHLEILRLTNFKQFSALSEFIAHIGGKLRYLDLDCVQYINLLFLVHNCPSLKCLHLVPYRQECFKDISRGFDPPVDFMSIPKFKLLTCLRVMLYKDSDVGFVISFCSNLRKLDIDVCSLFPTACLLNALSQHPLQYLEEITLRWKVSSEDEIKMLVCHCPQLKLVRAILPRNGVYQGVKYTNWIPSSICHIPL